MPDNKTLPAPVPTSGAVEGQQPFERYPKLARWFQEMATNGSALSVARWSRFLCDVNEVINALESRIASLEGSLPNLPAAEGKLEAIEWISEQDALPVIAEPVLLITPRQFGDFWDVRVARILVDYDGVVPVPIKKGGEWPVKYHWELTDRSREVSLVTGNSYWSRLNRLPLPPHAKHVAHKNGDYIAQDGYEWIGRNALAQPASGGGRG